MNLNNYASLEASKRLVEAGITPTTEAVWASKEGCPYSLVSTTDVGKIGGLYIIPAPSMAEVWRELPYSSVLSMAGDGESWVQVDYDDPQKTLESGHRSFNPTDALIDLLIWVRKEAKHDRN